MALRGRRSEAGGCQVQHATRGRVFILEEEEWGQRLQHPHYKRGPQDLLAEADPLEGTSTSHEL